MVKLTNENVQSFQNFPAVSLISYFKENDLILSDDQRDQSNSLRSSNSQRLLRSDNIFDDSEYVRDDFDHFSREEEENVKFIRNSPPRDSDDD